MTFSPLTLHLYIMCISSPFSNTIISPQSRVRVFKSSELKEKRRSLNVPFDILVSYRSLQDTHVPVVCELFATIYKILWSCSRFFQSKPKTNILKFQCNNSSSTILINFIVFNLHSLYEDNTPWLYKLSHASNENRVKLGSSFWLLAKTGKWQKHEALNWNFC